MPVCSSPDCTLGYNSNPEKGHFFQVPRNPERLARWKDAARKPNLNPKQYICHKHFKSDEIIWKKVLYAPDGSELGVSPYKIPRLRKDAVPSQFSWTSSKECSTSVNKSAIQKKTLSSSRQGEASSHETDYKGLLFTAFAPRIKVPLGWAMQYLPAKFPDILSIHERCCISTEQFCKTFTKKEIIVKKNLTVQISVLEEEIHLALLNISSTLDTIPQLQDIIYALDKTKICSGSHKPGTMLPIFCTTIKKDVGENWRHVECPLLVINSETCDLCLEAKKIVGICSDVHNL